MDLLHYLKQLKVHEWEKLVKILDKKIDYKEATILLPSVF